MTRIRRLLDRIRQDRDLGDAVRHHEVLPERGSRVAAPEGFDLHLESLQLPLVGDRAAVRPLLAPLQLRLRALRLQLAVAGGGLVLGECLPAARQLRLGRRQRLRRRSSIVQRGQLSLGLGDGGVNLLDLE